MARQIDFSQPLSEEDAQYVADRPWLRVDAELNGFEVEYENDDHFVVDSDGEDSDEADGESGSEDEESGEDDESEPSYDELDYQALKDEAKERGLSAAGSKEQLIARLVEDDQSSEEEDGEESE